MNVSKKIIGYLLWVAVALLVGICYMRIILGPIEISSEGVGFLLRLFYIFGLFHVGIRVGLIIAFLFILLDVFYLKKKFGNNLKAIGIRFVYMLVIALVLGVIHYVLEKVIDVI